MKAVDIDIKNGDNMVFTVVARQIALFHGTDRHDKDEYECKSLKEVRELVVYLTKQNTHKEYKIHVLWKHTSGLHGILRLKKGGVSL
jgi:hypothetical protein